MANKADGTSGGKPSLGKSVVSGKDTSYGSTASKGMSASGVVSGKVDPSFGTRAGKAPSSKVPSGLDSGGVSRGVSYGGGSL